MFELEVDFKRSITEDIPQDIVIAFQDQAAHFDSIASISLLQWEEHCTECAMPECYKSCDLYEPRKDGKCRRFTYGISPVMGIKGRILPVVRIDFKPWGALMATSRLALIEKTKVVKLEQSVKKIESIARAIPDRHLSILGRRGISSRLATRYKNRLSTKFIRTEQIDATPTGFLIELYNPNADSVDLTFVIRACEGDKNRIPYQKRLIIENGFNQIILDYPDLQPHIDPDQKHFISITPNLEGNTKGDLCLYFGTMGLFKYKSEPASAANYKQVKVVAWDLDNTIWDGILVEDGADKITIKPAIKSIIEELDRRGIVNSVISKNDYNDAWPLLEKFGLSEYLLFPQISWLPKSQSMSSLIADFNVGEDTVAFIDDSPFERAEVAARHPKTRVIDALEYKNILSKSEFNPEISVESPFRREFYRNQGRRSNAQSQFLGEYLDFIKSCNIRLRITHGLEENLDRIHELVQRTNQMNFSGNRYTKDQLREILNSNEMDTFTLQCEDMFGDYGTVGFCVVDTRSHTMIDLTFSCRVQSKRIEHAFVNWLLEYYHNNNLPHFSARYKKTERNKPAGKVFPDLGFEVIEINGDIIEYKFNYANEIRNELLIDIMYSV